MDWAIQQRVPAHLECKGECGLQPCMQLKVDCVRHYIIVRAIWLAASAPFRVPERRACLVTPRHSWRAGGLAAPQRRRAHDCSNGGAPGPADFPRLPARQVQRAVQVVDTGQHGMCGQVLAEHVSGKYVEALVNAGPALGEAGLPIQASRSKQLR